MGGISCCLQRRIHPPWAGGFCHFCRVPVVALHYKAISVAAGKGVVIKDVVFLSPYGAMLQSVCPTISPTNRAMPLSPPSCYNLLKRWCLDLYADILDSPASFSPLTLLNKIYTLFSNLESSIFYDNILFGVGPPLMYVTTANTLSAKKNLLSRSSELWGDVSFLPCGNCLSK